MPRWTSQLIAGVLGSTLAFPPLPITATSSESPAAPALAITALSPRLTAIPFRANALHPRPLFALLKRFTYRPWVFSAIADNGLAMPIPDDDSAHRALAIKTINHQPPDLTLREAMALLQKRDDTPHLEAEVESTIKILDDGLRQHLFPDHQRAEEVRRRLTVKWAWMRPWIQNPAPEPEDTLRRETQAQAEFDRVAGEVSHLIDAIAQAYPNVIALAPAASAPALYQGFFLQRVMRMMDETFPIPAELSDGLVSQGFYVGNLPHKLFSAKAYSMLETNHLRSRHADFLQTPLDMPETVRLYLQARCFDMVAFLAAQQDAGGLTRRNENKRTIDALLQKVQDRPGLFASRFIEHAAGIFEFIAPEITPNEAIQIHAEQRRIAWHADEAEPNPYALRRVRTLGRHLRGVRKFVERQVHNTGVDSKAELLRNRIINTVDYTLLIMNLLPLLEALEHDPDDQVLSDAILDGIAGDPELLLDRAALDQLHWPMSRTGDPHFFPTDLPPAMVNRYFELIDRHRDRWMTALDRMQPESGVDPLGRVDTYPNWLFVAMLFVEQAVHRPGFFSFDDYGRASHDPTVFERLTTLTNRYIPHLMLLAAPYDPAQGLRTRRELLSALQKRAA